MNTDTSAVRVLVVDNESSLAKFIKNVLERLFGWHADIANSPEEVFEFFERYCYNLVISDLNLESRINGADVILHARDCCPKAWTIVMSGNIKEKIIGTSLDKAMSEIDYLWQKPMSIALVEKTIRELLERGKENGNELKNEEKKTK